MTKVHSISPASINVIYNNRRIKIPIEKVNACTSSEMTSLLQEDKQTPTTETPTEELLSDTQEPQQRPSSIELNMNHNIRDNMEEDAASIRHPL